MSHRRPTAFDAETLTGRTRRHVVDVDAPRCTLHPVTARSFMRMRTAAARAGIDLQAASSFRDFDTQVRIWNDKWTGRRPLLDRFSRPLEVKAMSAAERARAILIWSAPPGASRHHWGTDLDVYDPAGLAPGERLALVPAEYEPRGPFAKLTAWLDAHMGRYGFYRPYRRDHGGVQPEPWHLSHWPVAREASRRLRVGMLREAIAGAGLEGGDALVRALPSIYRRYVRGVDRPPSALRRPART